MFKVNDYLEVKDLHIPNAYIEEFCEAFSALLDNHSDQLVDVAVLTNFNSEPVSQLNPETRKYLEDIGFKLTGERMIRGGYCRPTTKRNCRASTISSTLSSSEYKIGK